MNINITTGTATITAWKLEQFWIYLYIWIYGRYMKIWRYMEEGRMKRRSGMWKTSVIGCSSGSTFSALALLLCWCYYIWCYSAILCYSGATLVLLWCYSATLCYSGVTLLFSVTLVLLWCHFATLCYSSAAAKNPSNWHTAATLQYFAVVLLSFHLLRCSYKSLQLTLRTIH